VTARTNAAPVLRPARSMRSRCHRLLSQDRARVAPLDDAVEVEHAAFILETPYDDPRADLKNLAMLRSFVSAS